MKVITQDVRFDRFETGILNFDMSLQDGRYKEDVGLPVPGIVEIYGDEHTGKSTWALHVASKYRPDSTVVYADFEGNMYPRYAEDVMTAAGFDGTLRFVDAFEKKGGKDIPRLHEAMLDDLYDMMLNDPEVSVGIIDSIGMFVTKPEHKAKAGDRTVGQKPKTFNDFTAKLMWMLRETAYTQSPKLVIYINHAQPNIGAPGFYTPGGLRKQQAAVARIWIRRRESDVPGGTGCFVAKTSIQKLKQGGGRNKNRDAHIYFVPGYGISPHMSDLFQALDLKYVKRATTWSCNGEKIGKIGTLFDRAMSEKPDPHFKAVYEALREHYELEDDDGSL